MIMENIALRQVYFGGITIQVPEIWDVETDEMIEEDGQKSFSIEIAATGHDVRSIDISYGPMPEESDAYSEACGTRVSSTTDDNLQFSQSTIAMGSIRPFIRNSATPSPCKVRFL